MPKTYSALFAHIVFSTASRQRWIRVEVRQRLHSYTGGIVRNLGGAALSVGGVDDHIHLLVRFPPRLSISDLVGKVKANSSKWIHETWPELAAFRWQDGYAAFSVSASRIDSVVRYIERQEEHHKGSSYDDELQDYLRMAHDSPDSPGPAEQA